MLHKKRKRSSRVARRHAWIWKCLLGGSLGLGQCSAPAAAQEAPPATNLAQAPDAKADTPPLVPGLTFSDPGQAFGDPLAPAWSGPVRNVPNFMGDFVGRGLRVNRNTLTNSTLTYTGVGAEGEFFSIIQAPVTVTGPKGPFTLTQNIPIDTNFDDGVGRYTLTENSELTGFVRAGHPGATFVRGAGEVTTDFESETFGEARFFYEYFFTSGQVTSIALANPAGGGVVGRNKYFDNGSALPQDRVYFFYNRVGDFNGLGTPFNLNRYTFGGEKTFLDGIGSFEVRIPFAGTANPDQVYGQGLQVGNAQFGNIGMVLKGVVYRSPNALVSVGLGVSIPTADDSRMIVDGIPVVAIQNRTWLIQPLFGAAWAPTDRFYLQTGLQFDLDPSGNPVQALNSSGGLSRVGVLNDQSYLYLSVGGGYWMYLAPGAFLNGIALQGECHYNRSFGANDAVQDGTVTITDLTNDINFATATTGLIFNFANQSNFSIGVSFPISDNRINDWNLIAQVNYRFGALP